MIDCPALGSRPHAGDEMAEIEQKTPTFMFVGNTEAVPTEDKVTIIFGAADKIGQLMTLPQTEAARPL